MSDHSPALMLLPNTDAARSLSAHGVPLLLPRSKWHEPLRRLRYTALDIPVLGQGQIASLETVRRLGEEHPGLVFLPSSDGTALWAARDRERLAASGIRTVVPSDDAVYALLNKRRLAEECREAGVDVPGTVAVVDNIALERACASLRFPVIVKSQTRVGQRHWLRGIVAHDAASLAGAVAEFTATVTFDEDIGAADPLVATPLAQEYHEAAMDGIYHLTGYIDATGGLSATRAHRKVLQFPRRMGNAVCAESAPVDEALRDRLLALCRQVGYFGVFEAEFIPVDRRYLLIDFNPRFYNGMSLAIARGLDLPWLSYLEAIGDREGLAREIERANRAPVDDDVAFCRDAMFQILTVSQLLSRGMSWREFRRWRRWHRKHRGHMVDQFSDPADPWLGRRYWLTTLLSFLRNPRYFYGTFVRRP